MEYMTTSYTNTTLHSLVQPYAPGDKQQDHQRRLVPCRRVQSMRVEAKQTPKVSTANLTDAREVSEVELKVAWVFQQWARFTKVSHDPKAKCTRVIRIGEWNGD